MHVYGWSTQAHVCCRFQRSLFEWLYDFTFLTFVLAYLSYLFIVYFLAILSPPYMWFLVFFAHGDFNFWLYSDCPHSRLSTLSASAFLDIHTAHWISTWIHQWILSDGLYWWIILSSLNAALYREVARFLSPFINLFIIAYGFCWRYFFPPNEVPAFVLCHYSRYVELYILSTFARKTSCACKSNRLSQWEGYETMLRGWYFLLENLRS